MTALPTALFLIMAIIALVTLVDSGMRFRSAWASLVGGRV